MPHTLTTTCCPDLHTWLGFYSGQAKPDAVAALAAHLDDCSSCQAILHAIAASTPGEDDAMIAELRAVSPQADSYESESACRLALERVQAFIPDGGEWPATQSQVPERLGEYRILGLLGRGGMGEVFRAV